MNVDLSKTIRFTVVPSENNDFDQVLKRACSNCALVYSRNGEVKSYSSREEMDHCIKCADKSRKDYENGKPFEIRTVSYELPTENPQEKIKPAKIESEKIPPAPQDLFFVRHV